MFRRLFRRRRFQDSAHALYLAVVAQARRPHFYRTMSVPDTVDGRFDMIALHAFLLMHRLKAEADAGSAPLAAELSQAVFDLMFADMDRNLREMGVTDLGVAPKIKKMVAAFYGRVQAYEAGLAAPDEAALADALRRNLFRGTEAGPEQVDAMAAYLRMQSAALARQPLAALLAGQIEFGAPAGES